MARSGSVRSARAGRLVLAAAALSAALAACSGTDTDTGSGYDSGADTGSSSGQRYPDIVEVELEESGDGVFEVSVTVSSPYDSPDRYADGWRVSAPDGEVLGEHTLTHDHSGEQPFTRTQYDVEIPAEVEQVTVQGRDQTNGYGGDTVTVDVP